MTTWALLRIPYNFSKAPFANFFCFSVTRSQTKALIFDIDLAELLEAEEKHRSERLLHGYESEDSDIGFEDREDESGQEDALDPEFSAPARAAILQDMLEGELTEPEDEDSMTHSSYEHIVFSPDSSNIPAPSIPFSPSVSSTLRPVTKKRRALDEHQRAKKRLYKAARRNQKRTEENSAAEPYDRQIGSKRVDDSEVIILDADAASLPVASTGYQGIRTKQLYSSWTRDDVMKRLQYVDWDGRYFIL